MTKPDRPVAPQPLEHEVGDAAITSSVSDDAGCQQSVDTKAFTGRGRAGATRTTDNVEQAAMAAALRKISECEAKVDQIYQNMKQLAHLSKTVSGYSFYLAVHHRKSTGQSSLRWRTRDGHLHLSWDVMPQLFAMQLPVLAAWYTDLQSRVVDLNRMEQTARGNLHWARKQATFIATKRDELLAKLSELNDH